MLGARTRSYFLTMRPSTPQTCPSRGQHRIEALSTSLSLVSGFLESSRNFDQNFLTEHRHWRINKSPFFCKSDAFIANSFGDGTTTALKAFRLRRKQSNEGESGPVQYDTSVSGSNNNLSDIYEQQAKVRESRDMPPMRDLALGVSASIKADEPENVEDADESWLAAMTYDPSEDEVDVDKDKRTSDMGNTVDRELLDTSLPSNEAAHTEISFKDNFEEASDGGLGSQSDNMSKAESKVTRLKRVERPFSGISDKFAGRKKENVMRNQRSYTSFTKDMKGRLEHNEEHSSATNNDEEDDELKFLREGGSASNEQHEKVRGGGRGISWGQTTDVIRLSGPDNIYEEEEEREESYFDKHYNNECASKNDESTKSSSYVSYSTRQGSQLDMTSSEKYRRLSEEEGKSLYQHNQDQIEEFKDQRQKQPRGVREGFREEDQDYVYQNFLRRSASGTGSQTQKEQMEQRLEDITLSLSKEYNDGEPLNINSPKQVAKLLFGATAVEDASASLSTSRDTLEAMLLGTTNYEQASIARQILEWRKCRAQLKRLQHREEALAKREVKAQHHIKMGTTPLDRDPLLLVDASAFIFRAYHAMPPLHRQSDGAPVGAVLGFCNMLTRMVMDKILLAGDDVEQLPRLVLIFDSRDGSNFRKQLYTEYKANRPPVPEDLLPQFKMVQEAAHIFGIPSLEAKGYEADDVIATVTTWAIQQGMHVNLISSDKDLLQLVQDGSTMSGDESKNNNSFERQPSVCMVDPMTLKRMEEADVVLKWGVSPAQLGDVLALAGDASDNVPGVPGIGPKIASSLLQEFGSLEQVLAHAISGSITQKKRRENLIQFAEQARLSRQLVDLCRDVHPDNIVNVFDEYNNSSSDKHDLKIIDDNNDLSNSERGEDERTIVTPDTIQTTLRMRPLDQEAMLNFLHRMSLHDLGRRMANKFDRANRQRKKENGSILVERENGSGGERNNEVLEFGEDNDIFFDSTEDAQSGLKEKSDPKAKYRPPRRAKAKYRPPRRRVSSVPSSQEFDDIPF